MDDAWVSPFNNEKPFLAESFENIISIFEKENYKPTLFIIGKDIASHKAFVKQAALMGFELGNHTYSHPYLDGLKAENLVTEILDTHNELKRFSPVISFRAPGWSTNKLVDDILFENGYKIEASRVTGYSFVFLKLVHWFVARKFTKIYGRFSHLILGEKIYKPSNFEIIPLSTVMGFPFYHSFFKLLPEIICRTLIKISVYRNVGGYIFHARDFKLDGLEKSKSVLKILKDYYELVPMRDLEK